MGGIDFATAVKTVAGVAGTVGSTLAAKSQADYLNKQLALGDVQRSKVAGIDDYFLNKGKASGLNVPGFRNQFGEVDYAIQTQINEVTAQARKAREMIASSVPAGGAKLRALAQLSLKTQDEIGRITREGATKKRDLDIKLTNSYLQAAMNRKIGPSQEAKFWGAQRDYVNRGKDIQALGASLGTLAERTWGRKDEGEGVRFEEGGLPQGVSPVAEASYWSKKKPLIDTDALARARVIEDTTRDSEEDEKRRLGYLGAEEYN